jgi:hypothetical protein
MKKKRKAAVCKDHVHPRTGKGSGTHESDAENRIEECISNHVEVRYDRDDRHLVVYSINMRLAPYAR